MKGANAWCAALAALAIAVNATACDAVWEALAQANASSATTSATLSSTEEGGFPLAHTPDVPAYSLPEESFADDLEREAAALIDPAIERALACVAVMQDSRHSTLVLPFEEDANGYLAKLTAEQRALFDRFVAAGRRGEALSVAASDYNGDLKAAFFALHEPLTYSEPGLACWYDLEPTTRVRMDDYTSIYTSLNSYFFDPNEDQNVSVPKGRVVLADVLHDAALLDRVIGRIVRFMPDGLTTYDRYYYLAAVLSERAAYDARPKNCFTAYGALIGGRAVCEGYTSAYYLLCREAGLWCAYRNGMPEGQGHTWNMIRLDSGIYNVDVTWCDGEGAPYERDWYDCFVKSDADFADHAATTGVAGTGSFEPNPYEA